MMHNPKCFNRQSDQFTRFYAMDRKSLHIEFMVRHHNYYSCLKEIRDTSNRCFDVSFWAMHIGYDYVMMITCLQCLINSKIS